MANKSVYQDYDNDALCHFGLENEPLFGLITSDQVDDVLITQDETTFKKIRTILETPTLTPTNFQTYKRGFIIPKCPISQDRIKAACKEHKITITNDYEKADFIITHNDFYKKYSNGNKILTSMLMYRLWNFEAMNDSNNRIAIVENHDKSVIYDEKWEDRVSSYNCNCTDSLMDEWGIPGMAINLAYKIDIGEMHVLDVETLLHSSANLIELDLKLVNELSTWMDNSDEDNKSLIAKILPTIDYTKKRHLLWQLAQNIAGNLYGFNRDKDVQYWLEQSNLSGLYHQDAEDVILQMERDEILDKESFRYLEKIVRKDISIHNRELYTFKVSVKQEYKQYLK